LHFKYTEQKQNKEESIPQRLEVLLGVELEESGPEVEKALA
jgi:hypothetical protein